jgi:beta-aspartyl-peptidase (threonine type)
MLSSGGAVAFGKKHKIAMVNQKYFQDGTKEKLRLTSDPKDKSGTVGAVARDIHGNLAAATSTGGYNDKMPSRIGDSPLIGAGNFADNMSAAVSCTGIGEFFMRTTLASYIGFLVEREGMTARQAAQAAINRLVGRVKGKGAFIMVDKNGNVAAAQSSNVIRCGWIERGGPSRTTLTVPIRARKR